MRVQRQEGHALTPRASSPRLQTSSTLILLAFSLVVAFGLGFIAYQDGWHRGLLVWAPRIVRDPRAAMAAWQAHAALPVVSVDVRFADYEQLVTLVDRARRLGVHVPVEGEEVGVDVSLDTGERVAANMRLAVGPGSWMPQGAWPFELSIEGEARWIRLLPIEASRGDVAWQQMGYLQTLRREGFSAASLSLARVRVNGSDWGLYLLETPAVVAVEVRFGADDSWEALAHGEVTPAGGFRQGSVQVSGSDPTATRAAGLLLHSVLREAVSLSQVCDAEALGRFMALTALWTGAPAPDWRVMRWAYDGIQDQLVPVGAGQPWVDVAPLPEAFLADVWVQSAYARALVEYSDPAFLRQLQADLGGALDEQWLILATASDVPQTPWEVVAQHQQSMRARLSPERALAAELDRAGTAYVLRLANLQPFPVEVIGLEAQGGRIQELDPGWVLPEDQGDLVEGADALVLQGARSAVPETVSLRLPENVYGGRVAALGVACRLWGAETPELWVPLRDARAPFEAVR
ncbi:MAG: hypothetical protein ACP5HS_06015 [Anaerolineae bacterium]